MNIVSSFDIRIIGYCYYKCINHAQQGSRMPYKEDNNTIKSFKNEYLSYIFCTKLVAGDLF